MITVPTENQDPATVRRMFALALASEAEIRGSGFTCSESAVTKRADQYLKYIEKGTK